MSGIGIGFVWNFHFAEFEKSAEGALIDVVEAGFIAVGEAEGVAGGELVEGADEAVERIRDAAEPIGLVLQEAGFDGPVAVEAPVGGSHFFDEGVFDAIGGLEAVEVLVEHGEEVFGRFALEDEATGEQAMADRVAGGTLFTLRSDGAPGAGAIGA